jgi:hypothetical protein
MRIGSGSLVDVKPIAKIRVPLALKGECVVAGHGYVLLIA